MQEVRVRFAPSPTGHLHVGGARTALFNWLFARHHGGRFLLRIEDTDLERSREEATEGILDSLRWLGLDWDEGPEVGGDYGPYFQSQRLSLYREYAQRLLEAGRAYPCFCTPEEVEQRREAMRAAGQAPRYDRRCWYMSEEERQRRLQRGDPHVIRFLADLDKEMVVHDLVRGEVRFPKDQMVDDFVLVKSDGYPAYNFAVVVDDTEMRISHVIRGEEHLSNTPRQVQVYEALGLTPPQFAHLPIILGTDRSKLSKRHGAAWVGEYREQGYLPEALVNYLALLGWAFDDRQELFSIPELIEKFTLDKVSRNPAIFDRQKLDWMNGVYIREMNPGRLAELAIERWREAGWVTEPVSEAERLRLEKIVALLQPRVRTLADFVPMASYYFTDEVAYDEKAVRKFLAQDYVPDLLGQLAGLVEQLDESQLTEEHLGPFFTGMCESRGLKLKDVIQPVRVAVTGTSASPGIYDVLQLVGKPRVLARLRKGMDVSREVQTGGFVEADKGEDNG